MHLLNNKISWEHKHMTKPLSTPNYNLCSTQNDNMQCFSFIQSTNTKCKDKNSCSYTYTCMFHTCQYSDQVTARKNIKKRDTGVNAYSCHLSTNPFT